MENPIIEKFVINNNLSRQTLRGKIVLSKLWGDESFNLVFENVEQLRKLNDVILPSNLYGLYTPNKYEFIFQPIEKDYYCIKRKFKFIYNGNYYQAYYAKPSEQFQLIAQSFSPKSIEADENKVLYRNIKPFSEYYAHNQLPDFLQVLYKNIVPINFFVEGPIESLSQEDRENLLRHINFYMIYFDRKSPWIVIEEKVPVESYVQPCLQQRDSKFPEEINFANIDENLLKILSIARKAPTTRLQYLYYFQVLEYASYYFVEDVFRNKISNILRSPDLLTNTDVYTRRLIDEFQNKYYKDNSDSLRLLSVLNKYCEYKKIRNELKTNAAYFISDVCFDGGLVIKKIFSKEEQIETGLPNVMQTIKNNIEQIRNVLVHVRESHENKVILPTSRNEELIKPYLFLLRRMAEEVAMRYECV